ncbi:M81 family metallopeptidase [Pseudomaricurvus alkylphenolicus]|uniref:M81 family metallopeptidase n=1 Tax=Pseudomaricurvus alkylphenolicus TaxID=1306991 RepID=UPI00141D9A50|nr:M81 family metallopeptidase [Pseudomaricurvus alkylphenolicus]NIB43593.1 M81 family metallopeptidase [Pseudomaricurvus alkylphenolicus]
MKIFVASLNHETSSFSPIPTSRQSFEELQYHRPLNGQVDEVCATLNGYRVFVQQGLQAGYQVYASTYAWAQPSAPCNRRDYEMLRDEILDDLRAQTDVDMVFFFLHGAQMAEGYEDCEGDLLSRAREIVGEKTFIGAELDLHANVTELMCRSACLMACKHYPHVDFDERALDLFRLGQRAALGQIQPVTHYRRMPMVGMFYTTEPLMEKANAAAQALQDQSGVLSVSLIHGFRWADMPDIGAGVLAITNGERTEIAAEMETLANLFYEAREETKSLRQPIEPILEEVEQRGATGSHKPFVIADTCDNPGGGAGSDSTFILRAILERGLRGYGLALLWDPIVAQFAAAAGEGASLRLRLGGKTGPEAGTPLDVKAKVLKVEEGLEQVGLGFVAPHGLSAALEVEGNVVIVNSIRNQAFSPSCFTDFGIDPHSMRALIVKSTQHFYEQFAPLAEKIFYCETPGGLSLEIDPANYQHLPRPIWPLDELLEI